MRRFLLLIGFLAFVKAQQESSGISFGGSSSQKTDESTKTKKNDDPVQLKLGLISDILNTSPTGGQSSNQGASEGRNPQNSQNSESSQNLVEGSSRRRLCCCSSRSQCPTLDYDDYYDEDEDLVGSGVINPRVQNTQNSGSNGNDNPSIGIRIANRPSAGSGNSNPTCPRGRTLCCYNNVNNLNSLGSSCTAPNTNSNNGNSNEFWRESCNERVPSFGQSCGTRSFRQLTNLKEGDASPEEFPWTCLMLNQNNDFIGSCVIIPSDFNNNINRGTRNILTAAHKLDKVRSNELIKIRVLEYDASGFKSPETKQHQEFTVVKFVKHPNYKPKRLSNDIAILQVDRTINLGSNTGVNAACLPSCQGMFGQTFRNGTGTRCWTAGWGRDGPDGTFQFKMQKVDVPLVPSSRCNTLLKDAISRKRPSAGRKFRLDDSEICAGAESGKDACNGDGGGPLVCQTRSGKWHVVGLVAWGVGCAQPGVPGVYAKIAHFRSWIQQNMF